MQERLARAALEVCQDLADAYVALGVVAEKRDEDPERARELYENGVAAGEREIRRLRGPDALKRVLRQGDFYAVLETRGYVRARGSLAIVLYALGEREQAELHARNLSKLNDMDNLGRYIDEDGREASVEGITLDTIGFETGDRFGYLYDLGDYWLHDIRVESHTKRRRTLRHPRVLDGRGACPPEDCAGPEVYPVLVKLARGKGPVKGELREWRIGRTRAREELGRGFDTSSFDIGEANERLGL